MPDGIGRSQEAVTLPVLVISPRSPSSGRRPSVGRRGTASAVRWSTPGPAGRCAAASVPLGSARAQRTDPGTVHQTQSRRPLPRHRAGRARRGRGRPAGRVRPVPAAAVLRPGARGLPARRRPRRGDGGGDGRRAAARPARTHVRRDARRDGGAGPRVERGGAEPSLRRHPRGARPRRRDARADAGVRPALRGPLGVPPGRGAARGHPAARTTRRAAARRGAHRTGRGDRPGAGHPGRTGRAARRGGAAAAGPPRRPESRDRTRRPRRSWTSPACAGGPAWTG